MFGHLKYLVHFLSNHYQTKYTPSGTMSECAPSVFGMIILRNAATCDHMRHRVNATDGGSRPAGGFFPTGFLTHPSRGILLQSPIAQVTAIAWAIGNTLRVTAYHPNTSGFHPILQHGHLDLVRGRILLALVLAYLALAIL